VAEETAKAQAERATRAGKERATAEWRTAEALANLQVAAEEHEEKLREAVEARIAAETAAAEAITARASAERAAARLAQELTEARERLRELEEAEA
jgi:hypothetical protein